MEPPDPRLTELEQMTRPVSARAQSDARKNGSTRPRTIQRPPWGEDIDTNVPLPRPDDAMFYGLVGDVARAAARGTEVNPVAAGASFLAFLGAASGRDVHYCAGNQIHHPRLYTLHVGRSARGGKGEALSLLRRIRAEIEATEPELLGQLHSGGLSSREGLAALIHDGYTVARETFPAIEDKRLLVIESEFSNVLIQCRREGNTLSPALRDVWDGIGIRPATKTGRVWASKPHIGIAAAITPLELHSSIGAREVQNGFLNRFLMVWAERTGIVAFPDPTPASVLDDLAARTAEVVRYAKGKYPKHLDTRAMLLSGSGRRMWESVCTELATPDGSEQIASLMERRRPYAIRLAMLFALTDRTLVIEDHHLRAALAWIRYWTGSVRYIFADAAREARIMQEEDMAQRIYDFLAERPEGASQDEIRKECFSRKATPIPIEAVLSRMLMDQRFGLQMEEQPRADGKAGKRRKLYRFASFSCAVSEVSFFSEETVG